MTTAQNLYIVAFSVYLLFFVLFARFFIWKAYSERKHWNRRPILEFPHLVELSSNLGRKVPFISVLIPARYESPVIENTVNHMCSLRYDKDSYEIIVVTDEKEKLAQAQERERISNGIISALAQKRLSVSLNPSESQRARATILAVIAAYTLNEFLTKKVEKGYTHGVPELAQIPAEPRQRIIADVCGDILLYRGKPPSGKLQSRIKRACPWLSTLDVERVYPACLTVAMPSLMVYAELFDEASHPMLKKAIQHVARANHELTQDILWRMTESIGKRVAFSLRARTKTEEIRRKISETLEALYPTTQEVLERVRKEKEGGFHSPKIKHVMVPFDYDGNLNGQRLGFEVPSTKGRALNYGLGFLDKRAEVCGFYDAESRPHRDVLLYIGYRRLLDPTKSRILQGPVFQVRNFYNMAAFCRIAALYQAIAHDWYLPWLFRTLPFVGGTNVFVARDILEAIEGWDCHVLTEDLELGARAYLKCDAWPEYLPYVSSEQTPPTFRAFFRQRLRWGTGHLQVVEKVARDGSGDVKKRQTLTRNLIIKGQAEWVLYQMATFVPPMAMILHYRNLLDASVVPPVGQWVLSLFSLTYIGFTFYAFKRYSQYLDTTHKPSSFLGNLWITAGLLILPLAAFMFPVPYTSALILKALGKEPKTWVKTPRTEEERLEPGSSIAP